MVVTGLFVSVIEGSKPILKHAARILNVCEMNPKPRNYSEALEGFCLAGMLLTLKT